MPVLQRVVYLVLPLAMIYLKLTLIVELPKIKSFGNHGIVFASQRARPALLPRIQVALRCGLPFLITLAETGW